MAKLEKEIIRMKDLPTLLKLAWDYRRDFVKKRNGKPFASSTEEGIAFPTSSSTFMEAVFSPSLKIPVGILKRSF